MYITGFLMAVIIQYNCIEWIGPTNYNRPPKI